MVQIHPPVPMFSSTCASGDSCFARLDSRVDSHGLKSRVQFARGVLHEGRNNVAVNVQGRRDLRMPQDLHNHPRVNALGEQERRSCVPLVMPASAVHAQRSERIVEVPQYVPRMLRCSDGCREDKPMLTPARASQSPFLILQSPVAN